MKGRDRDDTEALERYLDDLLEGAELDAFERRLEAEPELAHELELQRAIDRSLGRRFGAPAAPAIAAAALPSVPRASATGTALRWARIAAALILYTGLTTSVFWWPSGGPAPVVNELALRDAYEGLLRSIEDQAPDFGTEMMSCNSPGDLTQITGFDLELAALPDVALTGPFTCELWPSATALHTESDGNPIFILIGDKASALNPLADPSGEIQCYTRVLGDWVIHEISKRPEASCLELFQEPPKGPVPAPIPAPPDGTKSSEPGGADQ